MGFSKQEYLRGLPFPSPGNLPDPGVKPGSPPLQVDALTSEPPGKNTRVGCCFLLQGIFLTQGSSLCQMHCRWSPALQLASLPLSHQGSPAEWVTLVNSLFKESCTKMEVTEVCFYSEKRNNFLTRELLQDWEEWTYVSNTLQKLGHHLQGIFFYNSFFYFIIGV